MTTIASQITSITFVYSTVYWDADQRKHQSSASVAFVWGIHRDRWIPRTKGQLRGKFFHLMTSSCSMLECTWWEYSHRPLYQSEWELCTHTKQTKTVISHTRCLWKSNMRLCKTWQSITQELSRCYPVSHRRPTIVLSNCNYPRQVIYIRPAHNSHKLRQDLDKTSQTCGFKL